MINQINTHTMTATFTFNLPEDTEDYKLFNSAPALHAALCAMSRYLDHKVKHEDLKPTQLKQVQDVREQFYHILELENIEL